MSAAEVGKQLVALCREGKNLEAINTLYAPNVASVEAAPIPGMGQVAEGIDAVRGKNEWWFANHEWHGGDAEGPYVHGDDQFAVKFTMDVTFKASGERTKNSEIGIYTVKDGKVVREQFYYSQS